MTYACAPECRYVQYEGIPTDMNADVKIPRFAADLKPEFQGL